MSDYSVSIKIAGELAGSFTSSLQGAQKGLSELAELAKMSGTAMKVAAKDIGASGTAIKAAAKDIGASDTTLKSTAKDIDSGTTAITGLGNAATGAGKKFNGFKFSIQGAKSGLVGLAKAAGKVGGATIKAAAKGISAGTVAVAGLAAAAVNVGKEFETAMSQVAATKLLDTSTKKGKAQFQALEDAARQCGATTAFSATEAAESLNNLSMAGYNTKEAVAALPTTLNLAGAGSLDLAQSASILTAGMASLGIDKTEKEFGHFADILAVTASKAKTDVAGIGEAITTVGKTAANLKGGTEEVAASLGILADVDLVGAEGGTHLRNMIMSLQNPRNKKAGELFSKLKLDAYDSQGKMRGLNEIFQDLSKSMAGMTDKQKNGIISTIFKQTDVAAASAMIENCGDRFDELYKAAKNSSKGAGAAADMYAKQMDNLEGDIDILKSSLSDLGISFYKDTGGPIREVTQAASEMVTQLNDAYKSGGLSSMVAEVGNCMGQIVDGIAQYAPMAVNTGIELVQNLVNGITQNSDGIASAAGNILTTFTNGMFSLVPQIALTGIDIILQLANSLTSQAPQLLNSGTQAITGFIDGLIQRGPEIANTAIGLIQTLASGIITNAPTLLMSGMQLIGSLITGAAQMLPQLSQMGIQLILGLIQGLLSNLPLILQTGTQVVPNLVNGITQSLPLIIQGGVQLITMLLQGVSQNLPAIAQTAVTIIMSLANGLISAAPQLIGAALTLPAVFIDAILTTDWLSVGTELVSSLATGIIDGLKSIGGSVMNTIKGWFGGGDDRDAENSGAEVAKNYVSGIESNIAAASSAASSLSNTTFSNINLSGATAAGTQAGTEFTNALTNIAKMSIDTGMDMTSVVQSMNAAGAESANAFNTSFDAGVSGNLIELDTASTTTAMSTAGTESANAFNTSFSQSLSVADTSALTNGIGAAGTKGAAALTDGFEAGSTGVTAAADTLGLEINTSLDTTWQTANTSAQTAMQTMNQTVSTSTQQMVSTFKSMSQSVTGTVQQMGSSIQNSLNSINLSSAGTNMMQGLVNGINSMRSQVEETAKDVAKAAAQSVNSALQIHSPSRLMMKSGQFIDEGLAAGMRDNSGSVKAAAQAAMTMPVIKTSDKMWSGMVHPIADARKGMQTSRVHEALNHVMEASTVHNNTVNNQSESNPTFVFSPTYQIQGNASKDDLSDMAKFSYEDFKKFIKRFNREQGRAKLT